MKIIITAILAVLLSACLPSNDEEGVTKAPAKAGSANHYEKEGIRCVKKTGPMETTTYLGLVSIDSIVYTGLRTEQVANMGGKSLDAGTSLVLDDGKKMEVYALIGDGSMKPKPTESAYSPDDIETSIMMAKHLYGECKSWAVDPKMFQRPKTNSAE